MFFMLFRFNPSLIQSPCAPTVLQLCDDIRDIPQDPLLLWTDHREGDGDSAVSDRMMTGFQGRNPSFWG